jgi:hypothetical protein
LVLERRVWYSSRGFGARAEGYGSSGFQRPKGHICRWLDAAAVPQLWSAMNGQRPTCLYIVHEKGVVRLESHKVGGASSSSGRIVMRFPILRCQVSLGSTVLRPLRQIEMINIPATHRPSNIGLRILGLILLFRLPSTSRSSQISPTWRFPITSSCGLSLCLAAQGPAVDDCQRVWNHGNDEHGPPICCRCFQ